jgi:hypothetical protein
MRRMLLLGFIASAVLLLGLVVGCRENKPEVQVLGEAQIIVYAQGEKTVLDPKSRDFRELQLACEEMLTSAESFFPSHSGLALPPDPEKTKSTEWAVELTYATPVRVEVLLQTGPTAPVFNPSVEVSRVLIPLSGELSGIEAEGVRPLEDGATRSEYVYLFLSPDVVLTGEPWPGPIGSARDAQKIRDILSHPTSGVEH